MISDLHLQRLGDARTGPEHGDLRCRSCTAGLTNLRTLRLSGTQVNEPTGAARWFEVLVELDLSTCPITDEGAHQIAAFSALSARRSAAPTLPTRPTRLAHTPALHRHSDQHGRRRGAAQPRWNAAATYASVTAIYRRGSEAEAAH